MMPAPEESAMSTSDVRSNDASGIAWVKNVDLMFEAVVIPVADVDRAKEFYSDLGWRLDADFAFDNGFRVVQFTPPGSGCSVQFGSKITSAPPGGTHRSRRRRALGHAGNRRCWASNAPRALYQSRPGIGSASAAREGDARKGSAKYCVSCVTRPSVNSMMLTEWVGSPS
jgi:catechol 2,3-dioxygenase-like lactoylglutathione lyase family enzyme